MQCLIHTKYGGCNERKIILLLGIQRPNGRGYIKNAQGLQTIHQSKLVLVVNTLDLEHRHVQAGQRSVD